jgi:hypothetical protein
MQQKRGRLVRPLFFNANPLFAEFVADNAPGYRTAHRPERAAVRQFITRDAADGRAAQRASAQKREHRRAGYASQP